MDISVPLNFRWELGIKSSLSLARERTKCRILFRIKISHANSAKFRLIYITKNCSYPGMLFSPIDHISLEGPHNF